MAGFDRQGRPVYRPLGGWVEAPDDLQPELEGEAAADVIIVGAGFAGLSTALELAARGAKVIVLEREFAGFGASGRNAGYLAGGQGLEYDLFLRRVGHAQAKQIIRFYDDGVDYVERKLAELGIDCEYNASGIIRAGVHPSQEKKLRKSLRTGVALGSPGSSLTTPRCARAAYRRHSCSVATCQAVARSIRANMSWACGARRCVPG